jgi:hypothetical protein
MGGFWWTSTLSVTLAAFAGRIAAKLRPSSITIADTIVFFIFVDPHSTQRFNQVDGADSVNSTFPDLIYILWTECRLHMEKSGAYVDIS